MIPHRHFALRRPIARFSLLAAALAFTFAGTASAATKDWAGSSSDLWSVPGNWSPNGVPASGDDVNITSATPKNPSIYDGSATPKLGTVTIGITTPGGIDLGINTSSSLTATQFLIGDAANTTGTTDITIKGALHVATDLVVGNGGMGYLNVSLSTPGGAGLALSTDGWIGKAAGGTGTATVDGAGSLWQNASNLTIGDYGAGTLKITNGGTVSTTQAVLGNNTGGVGNVIVDSGGIFTVNGVMTVGGQGNGWIALGGGGKLEVLGGGLNLGTGTGDATLVIGSGVTPGGPLPAASPGVLSVPNAPIALGGNGAIVFNHTASAGTPYVFPQTLVGSGYLWVYAGTTQFTADGSAFNGNTGIDYGGTLLVNGKLGTGAVTVIQGTLGGSGSIAGPVNVLAKGVVAPGNRIGTLTTGQLTLASGAQLDYDLGAAGGVLNDLIIVNGNLSINGGVLNIADAGGFGTGTYRLINYTGLLIGPPALSIGTVPAGFSAAQMKIDTSTPGQVNLIVSAPTSGTPTLTVSPPILTWSNVAVGSKGGVQAVTLTNTGTATLNFNGPASGPAAPFAIAGGNCVAAALPAGKSCTMLFDFIPTVADAFSSAVVIKSDSSTGPASITLSGTSLAAGGPALTILPTSLNWSNVTVGNPGGVQTVTLKNNGASLNVTAISAPPAPFVSVGGFTCPRTLPFTLTAGQTCTLTYDFYPASAGSFSASVNVTSSSGIEGANPPSVVAFDLTGSAVPPTLPPPPAVAAVPAPMMSPAMLFALVLMFGGGAWIARRRGT